MNGDDDTDEASPDVPIWKPLARPREPLHGITLKVIVEHLVARHGWEAMSRRIPIRCFLFEPTLASSLKFLRRTPWAREKVEAWYVEDQALDHPPHGTMT